MIALLKKFVNSAIGTAGAKPLDTMISEIKNTNLINYGSAVKSVQRGISSGNTSSNPGYTAITISPLTSSKYTLNIVGAYGTYKASSGTIVYPVVTGRVSISGSTLSVYPTDTSLLGYVTLVSNTFAWEIVEYY